MKLDIQLFGGRGASSSISSGGSDIKMKKGSFEVLVNRKGKDTIEKTSGKTFKYKGVEYGVTGSYRDGYQITHLKSGMLIGYSHNTLKELKDAMPRINKLVKSNKNTIKSGIDRFNKAKK